MKILKTIVLIFLLLDTFAFAGTWIQNESNIYSFLLTPHNTYKLNTDDLKWIKNFKSEYRKKFGKRKFEVFLKTDLVLKLNQLETGKPIYQHQNESKKFLHYSDYGARFLIDFYFPRVLILCCNGITYHQHKSKNFIVTATPVNVTNHGIWVLNGNMEKGFKNNFVTWH